MGAHNHEWEWMCIHTLWARGTTQHIVLRQCDNIGVHDLMYINHWGRYMERDFQCLGLASIVGIWRAMGQPFEMPGGPKFGSADEVTRCDQNLVRLMRSLDRCEASDAYCMILWHNKVEDPCHGERDNPELGWRFMEVNQRVWFSGRGWVRMREVRSSVFFLFCVWSMSTCWSLML